MDEITRYFLFGGLLLIAIANLSSMRLKTAPPIGSGERRWPWQLRDRYTRRGFITHSAGLILWLLGVLVSFVTFFE